MKTVFYYHVELKTGERMRISLQKIPGRVLLSLFLFAGASAGLVAYTAYMSRPLSYLSDDPSACVNCHIMAPYYQSWGRSSHSRHATCNACHVPHDNLVELYSFKAKDGLYHAGVFTLKAEPEVIRPRDGSSEVIMNNCIRCHMQLNTEFVKTGMIGFADARRGQGKACWDCHTQVPHTNISNISSSPGAIVPYPESPVPGWLKHAIENP